MPFLFLIEAYLHLNLQQQKKNSKISKNLKHSSKKITGVKNNYKSFLFSKILKRHYYISEPVETRFQKEPHQSSLKISFLFFAVTSYIDRAYLLNFLSPQNFFLQALEVGKAHLKQCSLATTASRCAIFTPHIYIIYTLYTYMFAFHIYYI